MCTECGPEYGMGTWINSGTSRAVYAYGSDKVLKVSCRSDFSNFNEWERWQSVKNTNDAKWFAEVFDVAPANSLYGHQLEYGWLVMERAVFTLEDYFEQQDMDLGQMLDHPYMQQMHHIGDRLELSDVHPGNIGMNAEGNLIFIDYGE